MVTQLPVTQSPSSVELVSTTQLVTTVKLVLRAFMGMLGLGAQMIASLASARWMFLLIISAQLVK